jgi:ureidoacrylate peracid hydrolase
MSSLIQQVSPCWIKNKILSVISACPAIAYREGGCLCGKLFLNKIGDSYTLNEENKKSHNDLDRLRAKLNPESTALIIIDMQKDFCCEGGTFHRRGFDIIPAQRLAKRLNSFLKEVREVLKYIIHLQMMKKPEPSSPVVDELYRRIKMKRFYDPAFAEPYEVIPLPGDVVIPKYKYSGFVSTYLDQFLRPKGINTLILTGIATNVCVESTARDGFMREYYIVIPSDLTEGTSTEAKKWSLSNLDMFFGEVVSSSEIIECWKSS